MKKTLISYFGFCLISFSALATPNPSSVHCEKNRGILEIRKTSQGDQYGVCQFGRFYECGRGICFQYAECEEGEFFRGICQKYDCYRVNVEYDASGNLVTECLQEV